MTRTPFLSSWLPLVVLLLPGAAEVAAAPARAPELLVILADTGTTCEGGLPRLTRHPSPSRHLEVLGRGFSGTLLRVYRDVQILRQREWGTPVEPAYLLLSTTQGGFPRFGFCLDGEAKPEVGYVDLHRSQDPSGRFGAMDQVFPHELLHVIMRQLAGEPPEGGSNQVHAVGVRTDRFQAFNEGFAEHAQVMALDDPDAPPDTHALTADPGARDLAWRNLEGYRRAVTAWWAPAPRHSLGFVLWFSGTEQALRYFAVKDNLFAREPDVPSSLLSSGDPWAAYLLENTMPGRADAPLKAQGRLVATEGVVAAVMVRWVSLPVVRERPESPGFYEAYGTTREAVSPLENAYLKLFAVMASARTHDLAALARAYVARFPDEAAAIAALLIDSGIDAGQDTREIWLATRRFVTGTSLFDQFRGLPRAHTFDLNAASPADLATVPGLDLEHARTLRTKAPYASIDEAVTRAGVPAAVADELHRMQDAFEQLTAASAAAEDALSLWAVFRPTLWRAAGWIAVGWVAGALLSRWPRRARWWRLAINGFGAAAFGLLAAWTVDAPWWFGPGVPLVLFGLPAVLWQASRRRWVEALQVAAAWLLAAVPVLVISQPIG